MARAEFIEVDCDKSKMNLHRKRLTSLVSLANTKYLFRGIRKVKVFKGAVPVKGSLSRSVNELVCRAKGIKSSTEFIAVPIWGIESDGLEILATGKDIDLKSRLVAAAVMDRHNLLRLLNKTDMLKTDMRRVVNIIVENELSVINEWRLNKKYIFKGSFDTGTPAVYCTYFLKKQVDKAVRMWEETRDDEFYKTYRDQWAIDMSDEIIANAGKRVKHFSVRTIGDNYYAE